MITAFENAKEYFKRGGNSFYCGQSKKNNGFKPPAGTFGIDTETYFVTAKTAGNRLSQEFAKYLYQQLQDRIRDAL